MNYVRKALVATRNSKCMCTYCERLRARYAAKPRITGPFVGGVFVCWFPQRINRASGMSPEQAWNNYQSYWDIKS